MDEQEETPIHGVLAVEGIETGDQRKFTQGALTWRTLPLSLLWQKYTGERHDGSVVVGHIDSIERVDHEIVFNGALNHTAEAEEVRGLIASRSLRGVSVDVDSATMELQSRDGAALSDGDMVSPEEVVETLTQGRISAATLCAIPAFEEAYIALGTADAVTAAAGLPEFSPEEEARIEEVEPQEVPGVLRQIAEERPEDAELLLAMAERMEQAWADEEPPPEDDGEDTESEEFRDVSQEERDRLAEENKALDDGSFPIANEEDLKNAIQAVGRASDPDKARRHIKKRAKELDRENLIPEEWAAITASTEEFLRDPSTPRTRDAPGWVTDPKATRRINGYWSAGVGAAKIGWGLPGDFYRCEALGAEHIAPQHLAGWCANRHHDALGTWPGQHAADTVTASAGEAAPAYTLVASAAPNVPPMDWFANPGLVEPTPLTVTDEGRVFGHVACWDSCHVGFSDSCVAPPASLSEYAYFCSGVVATDGGDVRCGQITFDTGHADLNMSSTRTLAHYDNTGTCGADVMAGEDSIGIWVAGALRPEVTDEQVRTIRGSKMSGDWRAIGGNLEMVAVLAVNTPGFPIPRPALAASAGRQTALVAAGLVPDQKVENFTVEEVVAATMKSIRERDAAITSIREAQAEVAAFDVQDAVMSVKGTENI